MKMFPRKYFHLLLGAALLLSGCDLGSMPGGGGGTEGEGLNGTLRDPSGAPVAGALVRVFPDPGISFNKRGAKAEAISDSTWTTETGRFSFTKIPQGAYGLQAMVKRGNTTLAILKTGISYEGRARKLGSQALQIGGSLALNVRSAGQIPLDSAWCRIAGTPYAARTDATGVCVIEGLPPGKYSVIVSRTGFVDARSDTLRVQAGQTAEDEVPELVTVRPVGQVFEKLPSTIALWTFNETVSDAPTFYPDLSGSGFNLARTGNVTAFPSPNGSSLAFEGGVLQSRFPENALVPRAVASKHFTIEARIRLAIAPSAFNADSAAHIAGAVGGYRLLVRHDRSLAVASPVEGQWTQNAAWTLPGVVPLGQWVNVGVTVDLNYGYAYAFVDGAPVRMYNKNAFIPNAPLYTDYFSIGGASGATRTFRGEIDEVRVSNAAVLGPGLPMTRSEAVYTQRAILPTSADATISAPVPGNPDALGLGARNRGRETTLSAATDQLSSSSRVLLRFSLPSHYAAVDIRSAVIRLTPARWVTKNADAPFRIDVHRMLKSWKEGLADVATNNNAAIDGATGLERFWGAQDGSEDWTQPLVGLNDVDAQATPLATLTRAAHAAGNWEFDVTDLAKTWAEDSTSNFGVLLASPFPATNAAIGHYPEFHSREAAVVDSLRPVLILNGN
jgi:hypothetical protein